MSRKTDPERVNQILQAASLVFAQQGFETARMEDVAAAAGLSKGALYLYFESKDALIIALGRQIFEQELLDHRRLAQSGGTLRERLQVLVRAIIGDLEKQRALQPVIYEFFALGLRRPQAREVLQNYFDQSLEILARLVQEGIDRGEIRAVDAQQAALALGAQIDGLLMWQSYHPETVDLEAQINLGLNLVLDALQKDAA